MNKKLNPIEKYAGGVLAGFMRSKLDAMALQPAIFSDLYGKKIEEQQKKEAAQVLQQAYRANLARKAVAEKMMPNLDKQVAKLQAAIKRKKATTEYREYKPQVQQTAIFEEPEYEDTRELMKKNATAAFDKNIAYSVKELRSFANNYAKLTELRNQYLPKGELTELDLEYTASPKQKLIYRLWYKANLEFMKQSARDAVEKANEEAKEANRIAKLERRAARREEKEKERKQIIKAVNELSAEFTSDSSDYSDYSYTSRERKAMQKKYLEEKEKEARRAARKAAEKEKERVIEEIVAAEKQERRRQRQEREAQKQIEKQALAAASSYSNVKVERVKMPKASSSTLRIKAEYTNEELDNMSEKDFNTLYTIAFPPGQGVPINESRGHQDIYNAYRRRQRKAKR